MATVAPRAVRFQEYATKVVTSPFGRPIDSDSTSSLCSDSSLSSINSQLMTHGWAKRPLRLEALSDRNCNEVVMVLYELMGSSVTNLLNLDNLSARYRTLTYENERLLKTHTHIQTARSRLETEVEGWKVRYADVDKRLALEESKTKDLREEIGRGRKAIEGVRIAAGHESKKMQTRLDKAQTQLGRLTADASLLSRPQGMLLLNPIMGGRTQPLAPGQSPLLEQSLKDLAEIRQSLQEETEAFRHVVVSTGNGLREVLSVAAGKEPPVRLLHSQFFANPSTTTPTMSTSHTQAFQSSSSTSHPSIADIRLRGLIAEVRTTFTNRGHISMVPGGEAAAPIKAQDEEERRRVEREQERSKRDLEEKVKDLEVEVTCVRAREEEAKRLVEEFARVQAQAGSSRNVAAESDDSEQTDALEIAREKSLLDEERRKFTEAAVRLGQERRQLEGERQAFLEEQRRADVEAMLNFLPPSPHHSEPTPDRGSEITAPFAAITSSWDAHRPLSPSPLSPSHAKNRTPKPHSAGRRRNAKTPLSRLVLEKAVRQKGRDTATALEQERLGVLGDGGRRGNTARSEGLKSSSQAVVSLKAGVGGLSSSTGVAGKRDLSKAEGIGPRGVAKGSKAWR